jgi:hypothetical protein
MHQYDMSHQIVIIPQVHSWRVFERSAGAARLAAFPQK